MDSNSTQPVQGEPSLAKRRPAEVDRQLVSEIFETLAQFYTLQTTLEAIATTICTRLGFFSCAILLERAQDDVLLIEGAAGLSANYIDAINRSHPIHIADPRLGEAPTSQAFRTGRAVIVEDIETDASFQRWRALARQQGIGSLIVLPLPSHGAFIGTLNCYQCEPRRYMDDEVQALSMAAAQVGMAIEIARLVEAQQQTIGRLHERQYLLEWSAQIHDTLMQLLLTNQGIAAIAATLARTISAPVLVQDQFAEVLASVNGQGQPSAELRPVSRTVLDGYARRHDKRTSPSLFEVPALPERGLDEPRAIAPIVANQQVLGHVSVVLPALPAPPLTLLALEQGSYVLALELARDRKIHEVELRVRREFAEDLLAGRYDDAEQMRARGRHLGYNMRGPFQVFIFTLDPPERSLTEDGLSKAERETHRRRLFDAVQHVARVRAPRVLVASQHDLPTMILTALDEPEGSIVEQVTTAVRYTVGQLLPGQMVSVGVGRIYPDLDQVRTSYWEASRALHVIRRLGGSAKTLTYADLGVARLLFQVKNPAELVDFARTRLGPILAYDRSHEGILLAAVEAYLAANLSVSQAAEQLNLHPNTFRYRLHKIEELLGTPLTNMALLLDLQLACMILRLIDTSQHESRDT